MSEKKAEERQWKMDEIYVKETIIGMFRFSVEGMKALYIITGGAAAALLAFFGHLMTINRVDDAKSLTSALGCFFFAALSGSGSFFLSYLTQYVYTTEAFLTKRSVWGKYFYAFAATLTLSAYISSLCAMLLTYLAFMSFK